MSLTCGLTAAEATQGKEQGKQLCDAPSVFYYAEQHQLPQSLLLLNFVNVYATRHV